MKEIYFDEIYELVCKVIDKMKHTNNKDYSTGIIAKYSEAKEVLKEFVMCDADIKSIDIAHPEEAFYEDEYYIDVFLCDDIVSISCLPIKDEDEYYDVENNIIYIFDDCNSRIYKHCEADEINAVNIGEDECDRDECACCKDEPYVINIKVNFDTDEAEDIIRKVRNDFHREVAVFKTLLDF